MSDSFRVVARENVSPFDTVELNPDHRLGFDDGSLRAVYPADADETEYRVALFPVRGETVELPDGAVVLSADESVIALVPTAVYGEN